jgi:hypothetical protein
MLERSEASQGGVGLVPSPLFLIIDLWFCVALTPPVSRVNEVNREDLNFEIYTSIPHDRRESGRSGIYIEYTDPLFNAALFSSP